MRTPSLLCCAAAVFCLSPLHAVAEPVFLEDNGIVIIEIESTPAPVGWTEKTEIDGYLGDSYFEWTGPGQYSKLDQNMKGKMSFTFRISNPGNYQMHWRSRIAQGHEITEANDSWLRLATGEDIVDQHPLNGWTKVYMGALGVWTWVARTVDFDGKFIRQYFSAGDHTLEIAGRSPGHAIDRIALKKYDTVFQSTFDDLPESLTSDLTDPPIEPPVEPPVEPVEPPVEPVEPPVEPVEPPTEPEPEPEPATDWSTTSPTADANSCLSNTVALAPSDDLYVAQTTISNSDELLANSVNQRSYLKFDLTLAPETIQAAELAFTVGESGGDATIVLAAGSHSDWTQSDATASAMPDSSVELGSFIGSFNSGTRYTLPLDPALLGNQLETVIIALSASDNSISIKSSETSEGPRLRLSGAVDFCARYHQRVTASVNTTGPDSTAEPQTDPPSTEVKSQVGASEYLSLLVLLMFAGFPFAALQLQGYRNRSRNRNLVHDIHDHRGDLQAFDRHSG